MEIKCAIGMLVLLLTTLVVEEGWAAQDNISCVNELLPCLRYIDGSGSTGSRSPSDNCCEPLKRVIKSDPECLCSMISIKGSNEAARAGINASEAQQLPARCGQVVNPIGCLQNSGSPNTKNSVPNSGSLSLPSPGMTKAIIVPSMIFLLLWALNTLST